MTGDRTPGLRERLIDALRADTYPYGYGDVRGDVLDIADAVLPVFEEETADLRERAEQAEKQLAAEREAAEQFFEQILKPERDAREQADQRAATAERLTAFYRDQVNAPADILNRLEAVEAELTAKDAEIARLRRQVNGYRGMKDTYLRERNDANTELHEDEDIISGLCDAIDRVQALPHSPLPGGEGGPPTSAYRQGWETAIAAVHSVLNAAKETP